ncbi:hypothetical protein [Jeotgalibacillus proteolyticus]|uniref:hypothetical protein n=1 Tax=Jeotgalibacillus proteolyticus TaxID=2082395 RepID=UPI001FD65EB6|nr:hypothetical protein [Jeotgalibacillus proteolyticus]
MKRNEIYYSLQCLDSLRLSMAAGWLMEAGIQPNTFGDWAKLEGERSSLKKWQLALLSEWHSNREPDEIIHIIERIKPEFIYIHNKLCEQIGMKETLSVEEILDMVL